ncbi:MULTISPECIES: aminotransferase class III-fold pyridoxal phosphate-dependent enzyme [Pseudomonas]|jgi:beta-alanine--pyruvate transaminase|uniref:Aminotransferase class III-fold pyridoxal phosphate-dependent enzyme n=1 Tax=Pseudomonas veronii TaxID=76761 RepID=A0A4P7YBR4_PSEVE|nr:MULTISPECIES: aminotransferase class III-fold pyridoxal phosphate-dependent enzyme [Pseudomonas]MBI6554441.1 aminotransferase class III-fold pyridoxal phosphate-dependent enzyme [Pseudomonas veronii]MBI6649351.1 aminotransferase class III-fold pyridoxal phosphate-dependent enzyme [Pseudomonas veronii]MBJ2181131.1 aminotransferase class III-fold pyridoxal phosphate-dependent enzyme [Pseudomonas veronii]MDF3240814.1 aminotransferase class III-fold pyridoxal phosphate-dependent enzyme [Pseudomo
MTTNLDHQWMPFTDNREFQRAPQLFVRAKGLSYWTADGRELLDGSSGLFCSAAGHGRSEIAEAVSRQLMTLDFTPHFQRGSPLSFELAERLSELLPEGLNKLFFTNSGSESVDSAMKIALAYHRARGEGQRTRFVSREWAYHGVNFGGVALSGMMRNRQTFAAGGLPHVSHMRHTWQQEQRFQLGEPNSDTDLASDLERIIATHGADSIAACFVEPIAGSIGVYVPPAGYLKRLRDICDTHGILLVFDEVITGIGRTGKAFAAQSFNVKPDIITMAKALTNGAVPMGAVAVDQAIFDTVVGASKGAGPEFFHGYTYSGHPVACAAALASLDIYRDEDLFAKGEKLSPYFLECVSGLRGLPQVSDLRGYGLLSGIQLTPGETPGAKGNRVQRALYEAGLHVKTTGDAIIFAPALVAERQHVDAMIDILKTTLGQENL